ncbi:MAG: hypothetical protein ACRD4O_07225 [Bryobacteraceae bacterium]
MPASAQIFSAGVRGGVPFNDAYTGASRLGFPLSTSRWIIGPTVELHLPFGLGVQADALYRNYTVSGTVTQWEFPILASYRFHTALPLIHPFVDAGPSFNHVSAISGLSNLPTRGAAGFAIGGGIEAKLLFLRVEPEIRYTHWGRTNFDYDNVTSNQNELEFLVGVTF